MSQVIQCDHCKEVIQGTRREAYEMFCRVSKDDHTIANVSEHHACSKTCVKAILLSVCNRVETSR